MAETVETPRVWITSFWGFDPENEGYLGFTYEGNRSWFLDNWREGDLILIYGADAPKTEPETGERLVDPLDLRGPGCPGGRDHPPHQHLAYRDEDNHP